MIDRNTQNLIVWEEPGADRLDVVPKRDVYDNAEIRNVFDVELTEELGQEEEAILFNADVQIDCDASEGEVTIFLLVLGNPPYILRRGGEPIDTELTTEDFPYTDTPPDTGEFCYEIEDFDSTVDEVCCIV